MSYVRWSGPNIWWILRKTGNDDFWIIVDGPYQLKEDAYKAMDMWRNNIGLHSWSILNMAR